MRCASAIAAGLLTCFAGTVLGDQSELPRDVLSWDALPAISPMPGPLGVFCGASGARLIVAGGARPASEGGEDGWLASDRIYLLSGCQSEWMLLDARLPRPLAFGLSLNWGDGILCVGGTNGVEHRSEVFFLRWREDRLQIDELPPMPGPAAFACGGVLDGTLYIAGGLSSPEASETRNTFWALELGGTGSRSGWKELETWPGSARMLATSAVQDGAFFLFGGLVVPPGKGMQDRCELLRDAYRFDPRKGWRPIHDLPVPLAAPSTPSPAIGQSHVFLFGGWTLTEWPRATEGAASLQWSRGALVYHAITDTWTSLRTDPLDAIAPQLVPLAPTTSTRWRDRILLPKPKLESESSGLAVLSAEPRQARRGLRGLDYLSLGLYLAVLVCMGIFFARRGETTSDFFLGGHRVPWWAAGISLFGTKLSSLTFLAIPAMVYQTDWTYLLGVLMTIAVAPVIVSVYLPYFRRAEITSAYEYLEKRFHVSIRLLASLTFLLLQLARMGVVLYLPALALAAVTGLDVYLCIVVMGVLATFYTVLGGIQAVIWSDVFQVIILLGGAAICLLVIIAQTPDGLSGLVTIGQSADKFQFVHWSWEITSNGLWVVLVGNFFANLISYSSDQSVIQRYLTTATERQAARAIWTNAVITLPAALLFFALGTALWVFYRTHPHLLSAVAHNDQILPWFIARQLPAGLVGLLIAALCAASMSTLDSSINSMATSVTTDFFRRFHPAASDHFCLRMARVLTLLFGLAGTGSALWIASLQSDQIWRESFKIVSLLSGGLGGLFVAGIFTRKATAPGMAVGFFASGVVLYFISTSGAVHFFLFGGVGMLSCVVLGWLASRILPWGQESRITC